jgi:hypothetical protein
MKKKRTQFGNSSGLFGFWNGIRLGTDLCI